MPTLTCKECNEAWEFEVGLAPPEGWAHYCSETAMPELTARDMEDDVALAVKQLNTRGGSNQAMETRSGALRGARLALDNAEYKTFVRWVRQAIRVGALAEQEHQAQ